MRRTAPKNCPRIGGARLCDSLAKAKPMRCNHFVATQPHAKIVAPLVVAPGFKAQWRGQMGI
jgi:hypothetical protein